MSNTPQMPWANTGTTQKTVTAVTPTLTTQQVLNASSGIIPPNGNPNIVYNHHTQQYMNPIDPVLGKSRDDSCYLLLQHISLNRYDNKFIMNITKNYVQADKGLTQKQSDVFEIIVKKYRKQFKKKLKINHEDVLAQEWNNDIVPLEVLNNKSYLKVSNNEMLLHFHFNKEMIDEVRTLVHDDECIHVNKIQVSKSFGRGTKYDFIWSKESTEWKGPFNSYLFHDLYKYALKHNLPIDQSVHDIIDEQEAVGTKEQWTTSLQIVNKRMYINNITESMLTVVNNIDFNDFSVYNIEKICRRLGLEPPNVFSPERKHLMTACKNSLQIYNTREKHAQDELKAYLESVNKRVLLFMQTPGHSFNYMADGERILDNEFLTKQEMAKWENRPDIVIKGDHEGSLEDYDIVISTYSFSDLVSASSVVAGIAEKAEKYIRVK